MWLVWLGLVGGGGFDVIELWSVVVGYGGLQVVGRVGILVDGRSWRGGLYVTDGGGLVDRERELR